MNKNLHIKQIIQLTTKTYDVKFTHKEGCDMEIIEANIDFKIIGKRIKEARKNAGLSQEKLAEKIDVGTVYISRVEKGGTQVNLRRLSQISIALNVPIEKLIIGTTQECNNYLDKEFKEILSTCTIDKQKLIYNIAKIVSGIKFV